MIDTETVEIQNVPLIDQQEVGQVTFDPVTTAEDIAKTAAMENEAIHLLMISMKEDQKNEANTILAEIE